MSFQGPAQNRYEIMQGQRNKFLNRAREAAAVTLPQLFPLEGKTAADPIQTPFQGVGARNVNNLASKLLLAGFPSNVPFFRQKLDADTTEKLRSDPALKTQIEKALSRFEQTVMGDVEDKGDRVVLFETLKHLIVGGNALLYMPPAGLKLFHLDRYVARRDPMGTLVECVVKETFDPITLPSEVQELIGTADSTGNFPVNAPKSTGEKTVDVYTHIQRRKNQWFVYQEVKGLRIPGSESQWPLNKSPWLALRLIRIDGEDYGRGFVEEYLGDLISLEVLSKAVVEGAAAMSKVLFLVKPNGMTRTKVIARAPNGAIREGNADDVTVVKVDKFADFRVVRTTMDAIESRLALAFLDNLSIQRDAERVTAEEIRFMAQQLDAGLGGVFSILTRELSLPYVTVKIAQLQRAGVLPRLPIKSIRTTIVTGLAAIGRGQDGNKLLAFLGTITKALGPEEVVRRINATEFIDRVAVAEGIDTDNLIRPEEEVKAEMLRQQQMALATKVAPEIVKQGGKAINDAASDERAGEGVPNGEDVQAA